VIRGGVNLFLQINCLSIRGGFCTIWHISGGIGLDFGREVAHTNLDPTTWQSGVWEEFSFSYRMGGKGFFLILSRGLPGRGKRGRVSVFYFKRLTMREDD